MRIKVCENICDYYRIGFGFVFLIGDVSFLKVNYKVCRFIISVVLGYMW